MKKAAVIILIFTAFSLMSCYIFDGISDVSMSLVLPDELVIANNARVSTLRSIEGKIVRANMSVYIFHFDTEIPAGYHKTIKIDDFVMLDGDKVLATDAKFSCDM
jgi:uncharacterized protein (UPF0248 family)